MNPETGFDGTGLIILAAIAALILVVVIRKRNKNKPTKNPNETETGKEPRESTKKKTSKLEQNRRARELQEKKDNAKKEARRAFRITAPVVFIGFSIAIGWPNLVDFFTESTGVNAKAANFLAFIFAFGTLWAGTERYLSSRKGETKGQFTLLLWAILGIEASVHLVNGVFYNNEITWYGALILAILSPLAGAVFEMAVKANRSDVQDEQDEGDNRKIPTSYRGTPLVWIKLNRVKNANPTWDVNQIVTHVRVNQAARVVRRAWAIQRRGPVMRFLMGEEGARGAVIKALVELNPYGAPTPDPKLVLARQLNLTRAADAIIAAGESDAGAQAVLEAFRLQAPRRTTSDAQGVQKQAPDSHVQPYNSGAPEAYNSGAPEAYNSDPSGAYNSDPSGAYNEAYNSDAPEAYNLTDADIDEGLRKLLGQDADETVQDLYNSSEAGVQDPYNSSEVGVQDPCNPRTSGRTTDPELYASEGVQVERPEPAKKARRKTRRKAEKKKTADRSNSKDQQVSVVYNEVVRRIKGGEELPSVRWVRERLGVSQGTAANRLNQAKEAAQEEGHSVQD